MRPAVSAYRSLLKAQRELFAGDTAARLAARNETRARFVEHSSAPAEQVEALVNDALDAAGFIRQNVAQAVLNERGNYGESCLCDSVQSVVVVSLCLSLVWQS